MFLRQSGNWLTVDSFFSFLFFFFLLLLGLLNEVKNTMGELIYYSQLIQLVLHLIVSRVLITVEYTCDQ